MNIQPGAHIHLMGICGTAMASLAGLLKQKGFKVTGSDTNIYPPMSTQLENLKIPVSIGYGPENLKPKPDFVVVGNVITRQNPEAQALLTSSIPYTSLPKMMGEMVIADRHAFVLTGTHGKTTSTALTAWVMDYLGLRPGFMVGGIPVNFNHSFECGEGNVFAIEGDEYDTAFFDKVPKFIHYKPRSVALTSVEFDHVDIYENLEAVRSAFRKLMALIPSDGLLVHYAESSEVASLAKGFQGAKISYGLAEGDLKVSSHELSEEGMRFSCTYKGEALGEFESPMFGEHNLLNHLAVLGFAIHHQWNLGQVKSAFKEFRGVKRRQEILGKPNGIWVIEDFAHHPTAVQLTIESVKKRFPKSRLFSLFEPRSATSRRKVFQDQYVESFALSDVVLIAPPFGVDKIPASERFSSEELVEQLKQRKVSAQMLGPDPMVDLLKTEAKPGDVILVMSNGAFDGIYAKILKSLS